MRADGCRQSAGRGPPQAAAGAQWMAGGGPQRIGPARTVKSCKTPSRHCSCAVWRSRCKTGWGMRVGRRKASFCSRPPLSVYQLLDPEFAEENQVWPMTGPHHRKASADRLRLGLLVHLHLMGQAAVDWVRPACGRARGPRRTADQGNSVRLRHKPAFGILGQRQDAADCSTKDEMLGTRLGSGSMVSAGSRLR